jgi:flagellin
MRINNNIMALNAHRQLAVNQTNASKSMERLSSGMRINRAGDDAAGLAISEKMRGQIRGLKQAQRNAQDGISLIQTAEGALNEIHAILQRMRELATQSATDTNTEVDRGEIQKEIDQLAAEITRIAETTEFNTQNLLGGSFQGTFHIGANEGQNINLAINAMDADSLGVAGSEAAEFEQVAAITGTNSDVVFSDGTYSVISVDDYSGTALSTNDAHYGNGGAAYVTHLMVDGDGNAVGVSADGLTFYAYDGVNEFNSGDQFTLDGETAEVTIDRTEKTVTASVEIGEHSLEAGTYTIVDVRNHATYGGGRWKVGLQDANGNIIALGDVDSGGSPAGTGADTANLVVHWVDVNDTTNALLSHSANSSFAVGSEIVVTGAGIDVSSQPAADAAITTIQSAIETVSAERSKLGAYQNRLEHTISNLGTSAENLQAAESRIRDLDMAEEIMAFTKNNILQQAATAMLAQANMAPQSVLQLLG